LIILVIKNQITTTDTHSLVATADAGLQEQPPRHGAIDLTSTFLFSTCQRGEFRLAGMTGRAKSEMIQLGELPVARRGMRLENSAFGLGSYSLQ